ncbi:pentatricopeptide repeat-containing protein DOT4 [Citrus sinensis]|uniref:Pentatricopeptide repeat-containing protein DOT4 n=1 Tax=Citrus sinensis TaxID=2711 RepID=A0ACB8IPA3_CITSI|nr:pentatricopeptide repeat-containing protein DOT4 [Citrus sinensis]
MPFSYYSLSFCKPQEGVKDSAENRGELLMGDRIENSPYRFKTYTNETDIFFCKTDPLSKDNFELLKRRIDEMYQFIGFCFWDGYDQENALDLASNHAQLNISISNLNNSTNSEVGYGSFHGREFGFVGGNSRTHLVNSKPKESPSIRCQSTGTNEPKTRRNLLDNASNLLTNLLSGGSLGSMPVAEGAVFDLFSSPLFFYRSAIEDGGLLGMGWSVARYVAVKVLLLEDVHGQAFKLAFSADHRVISALLDLYGRLDSIDSAKWVFVKSVKSTNAYVDRVALATAVGACRLLKSMQEGRKAHRIATKYRLEFDVLVSNSIDCGSFADARAIFDRMPSKDVISWMETIVFSKLRTCALKTMMDGTRATGLATVLGAFPQGYPKVPPPNCSMESSPKISVNAGICQSYHGHVCEIRIYSVCFKLICRDQGEGCFSWTVMILGYSLHGQRELGLSLFSELEKKSSIEIDPLTFAAVLHACSTAGMVEEGWLCFNRIRSPKVTHHALMVSVLARAGLFDEARIFIQEYHMERYPEVLRALLEGCRIHVQVKTGKRVIDQLCELKPLSAENYIMLSNWYAAEAKWDVVNQVMYPAQDQREYFGSYSL